MCVCVWFMSLIVFRTAETNSFSCSCCRTHQCWRHTCSLTRAARQEHSATGLMAMVLRMPVQVNWMQPVSWGCVVSAVHAPSNKSGVLLFVLTFSHSFNSMCGSDECAPIFSAGVSAEVVHMASPLAKRQHPSLPSKEFV